VQGDPGGWGTAVHAVTGRQARPGGQVAAPAREPGAGRDGPEGGYRLVTVRRWPAGSAEGAADGRGKAREAAALFTAGTGTATAEQAHHLAGTGTPATGCQKAHAPRWAAPSPRRADHPGAAPARTRTGRGITQ
jgi:hypothetical protein